MSIDPRAENCRQFREVGGLVMGVELQVHVVPSAPYELLHANLIDEATNGVGGPVVIKFHVLDADNTPVYERVYLAAPWPELDDFQNLPGNQNNEHMLNGAIYAAPAASGPLGLFVGDSARQPISDLVGGFGLPNRHHISFDVTFRKRSQTQPPTGEGSTTPPPAADHGLTAAVDRLVSAVDRLTAVVQASGNLKPEPAPIPAPEPGPTPQPKGVTTFSQRDQRWADQCLGAGPGTIGTAGCLIAAVASCLVDLGINTDAGRLNSWLSQNNGFENGNAFRWYSLGDLGVNTVDLIDCQTVDAPLAKLRAYLANGLGVVALVDYNPKTALLDSHWVRLLAIDADGRDADIMDPWQFPGQELTRLSRYLGTGYDGKDWNDVRGIFGAGVFGRKG